MKILFFNSQTWFLSGFHDKEFISGNLTGNLKVNIINPNLYKVKYFPVTAGQQLLDPMDYMGQ